MASYTGMRELSNHVHRSGADLSQKKVFTAKSGELLPIFWDIALPDNKYDIDVQYFTRTLPVNTAAYTRIREYFDFYAVPIDLLWKSFDASVIQMGEKAPVQSRGLLTPQLVKTDLPWCTLLDISKALSYQQASSALGNKVSVPSGYASMFGFNKGDLSHKLITYLCYGNVVDPDASDIGTANNRWWNHQSVLSEGVDPYYSQKYQYNYAVNILPLLAYQKVYQDFFRWSQWENADPTSYNIDWYTGEGNIFGSDGIKTSIPHGNDYWKRDNMFSLRYANWNKDMFMGILPDSQFGDVSVVYSNLDTSLMNSELRGQTNQFTGLLPSDGAVTYAVGEGEQYQLFASAVPGDPNGDIRVVSSDLNGSGELNRPIMARYTNNEFRIGATGTVHSPSEVKSSLRGLRTAFSVLALRQAEALQKFREISQSVDTDYRSQIEAHFGVKVPASDSHRALYIGGIARNLDISEVVNQTLDTSDSQATIYGKGVGTGNGGFRFDAKGSYWIIMGIYHNQPLLDYDMTAPDSQLLCTSVEDLPIPEFDSIGMQPLFLGQFMNSNIMTGSISPEKSLLGYLPRYYAWKTKVDTVHGAFTTSLRNWVAPISAPYLANMLQGGGLLPSDSDNTVKVSYPFFKVNPIVLDPLFSVSADSTWETDPFLVNCHVGCKVVHNLSADGMPY